jgi:hypothetical protein
LEQIGGIRFLACGRACDKGQDEEQEAHRF